LTNFILIRFETTEPQAFWKRSPQQEEQQLPSDMRSVPDLKINATAPSIAYDTYPVDAVIL